MSVLKNLRSLSEMQFYKTAITIRKELTIWLLKDFGTRRNAKSVNQVIKDITPEEQAQIDAIFARYGRTSRRTYQSEYPDWFVEFERKIISENLAEMVTNITQANSIFPYFAFEWDLRRKYQDMDIREVITPVKATITRERRKLRKLKARLDNGLITKAEIEAQYKSWRGTLEKYDTYRRLRATDALYRELFKG